MNMIEKAKQMGYSEKEIAKWDFGTLDAVLNGGYP